MKSITIKISMIFLAATLVQSVLVAQKADPAEVRLKAVIQKEIEDGDLKGAIEMYKKILAVRGVSRPVAAQALLHLGLCSEKLRAAEAGKYYEQLVREYSDQAEAVAEARARLANLQEAGKPAPTGPVDRPVWVAPAGRTLEAVSQDGRYVLYGNRGKTTLWVHDLATGKDRDLIDLDRLQGGVWFSPAFAPDGRSIAYFWAANMGAIEYGLSELWLVDFAGGRNRKLVGSDPQQEAGVGSFAFSPDSKQIVYEWEGKADAELRIVNLDGSHTRVLTSSRDLAKEPGRYVVFVRPGYWSPDGKSILANGIRERRSRVYGLISVSNDSARVFSKEFGICFGFSPDSKYLACSSTKSGASLVPVDGGLPVPLFSDPASVVGTYLWTPDGRGVVLRSNRSGTWDLWAVRVSNGKPEGDPIRLKQNFTPGAAFGLSPAGIFYYSNAITDRNIYVADLDPATGKVISTPEQANTSYIGTCASPIAWSPDGQFLAFARVSQVEGVSSKKLLLRSFPPGKGREVTITPPLSYGNFGFLKWFPDGRSLLLDDMRLRDNIGSRYVFCKVDVETGKQTMFFERPGNDYLWHQSYLSNDGKSLYFSVMKGNPPPGGAAGIAKAELLRGDVEKVEEEELYQTTASGPLRSLVLSPDERQLAFFVDNQDGSSSLGTVPVAGGSFKELYRSKLKLGPCVWTRNSPHVLFVQRDTKSGYQLMSISASGGDPVFTGLTMPELGALSVHPDGRRLAFVGGITRQELWTITNLLPNSK